MTTRIFLILLATLFAGFAIAITPKPAAAGIPNVPNAIVSSTSEAHAASSTISSAVSEASLTPCIQQCFQMALSASGCGTDDHTCICPNQIYITTALQCLSTTCPNQIPTAESLQFQECASVVGSATLSILDQLASSAVSVNASSAASSTVAASITAPPSSSSSSSSEAASQGQQQTSTVVTEVSQPSQSSSAAVRERGWLVGVVAFVGLVL